MGKWPAAVRCTQPFSDGRFFHKACCSGVKRSGTDTRKRAGAYSAPYSRDNLDALFRDEKCRKKSYFQTEKVRKAAFRELTVVFLMFP